MAKASTEVGQHKYNKAKRPNQPSSETAGAVDATPKPFSLPRRGMGTSDTALAWRRGGLAEWDVSEPKSSVEDPPDYEVSSYPLYTHERVNPAVLVDQMRRTDLGHQASFSDFNGLPEGSELSFYEYEGNWQNRLIHADSAEAMRTLLDRDQLEGKVQMVYFDPPYGIKFKGNFQPAVNDLSTSDGMDGVPVGDGLPLWCFRDTWQDGIHSYLDSIYERLVLIRALLSDTGSVFLQIGAENMTRLALVMDEVFGADNKMAIITYRQGGPPDAKHLPEASSYLLWWAKDKDHAKYNQLYEPFDDKDLQAQVDWAAGWGGGVDFPNGISRLMKAADRKDTRLPQEKPRIWNSYPLISNGRSTTGRSEQYAWVRNDGTTLSIDCPQGVQWRVSTPSSLKLSNEHGGTKDVELAEECYGDTDNGLDSLAAQGRLFSSGNDLRWKWYASEYPGTKVNNQWGQFNTSNKRYIVETASKVVERCILMASDPGDLVLDPTCGSGVTAALAEEWGRRWVTIDSSRVPIALARERLMVGVYRYHQTKDGDDDPTAGFVCETMPKISAANLAYCRTELPEEQIVFTNRTKKRRGARICSAFTVESQSAHAYESFDAERDMHGMAALDVADIGADGVKDWDDRLIDFLTSSTVCDADGGPVYKISDVEPWPACDFASYGAKFQIYGDSERKTAPLMLASPVSTVTNQAVLKAINEARTHLGDFADILCAGFAFAHDVPSHIGKVEVHRLCMTREAQVAGLTHGDDQGTLTLLGDIDVLWHDEGVDRDDNPIVSVEVLGFDSWDPKNAQLSSSDARNLTCWMVDTDYDTLKFFSRLVYFPNIAKRKGTTLKAITKAIGNKRLRPGWEDEMQSMRSQPFTPGRMVAVKLITTKGIEMTSRFTPDMWGSDTATRAATL